MDRKTSLRRRVLGLLALGAAAYAAPTLMGLSPAVAQSGGGGGGDGGGGGNGGDRFMPYNQQGGWQDGRGNQRNNWQGNEGGNNWQGGGDGGGGDGGGGGGSGAGGGNGGGDQFAPAGGDWNNNGRGNRNN